MRLLTRYVVALWATLGIMLVYMMRVNLSVAIAPMSAQFGWSNATKGFVLSAFFIGYVVGQVPGGHLASLYGRCMEGKVEFVCVCVWHDLFVCSLFSPSLFRPLISVFFPPRSTRRGRAARDP